MIKSYLQQLSSRERYLVLGTGGVVLVILFYFALWAPLQEGIENKRRLVSLQEQQLDTMQEQARDIGITQRNSSSRSQNITDSSSLLSVIERTAKQRNLKSTLQKAQPEGNEGVRLWLVDITFDQMIEWLNQLDLEYGIYVSDITIERDEKYGRVDSRILLRVKL
jgi:general secretion pathway protein M